MSLGNRFDLTIFTKADGEVEKALALLPIRHVTHDILNQLWASDYVQ